MRRTIFFLTLVSIAFFSFRYFGEKPVLYIIGDSTVKNGDGSGKNNLWGWGSIIGSGFDTALIRVENHAIGGRSSRTFITEGHWDKILERLRPGDFVIMQFGHNDGGPLDDTARARGTISGTGEETREIYNPIRKQRETVHSYGWYIRKYVADTRARGAVPVVCSPVPRCIFKDGKTESANGSYGLWAKEAATAAGAWFIPLNDLIAKQYDSLGQERVRTFFPGDHTHTNFEGAALNSRMVLKGIAALDGCRLKEYITVAAGAENTVQLAGQWQFAVDRDDRGIAEEWFNKTLPETIILPGSMLTNDKGDIPAIDTKWTGSIYDSSWFFNPRMAKYRHPGNLYFPFWLTPSKHYVGAAWYRRTFVVPEGWKGRNIRLLLERVHTISGAWIDGRAMGQQNSLSTAHQYGLGPLSPGMHTLALRIDNRIKEMNVGPDSHSVTDHTQGNWNGVIGRMELEALPAVYAEDIQVFPDIEKKQALVKMRLSATGSLPATATVTINAVSFNSREQHRPQALTRKVTLKTDSTDLTCVLAMGNGMLVWDEFDPALYRLTATVTGPDGHARSTSLQFGMHAFGIKDRHFTNNGRPVFLRGTVNNCEFPLTGFPPTDTGAWLRIFRTASAHGLNHMRFHSWCPPEAAFAAADIAGFYLQPEVDSWPNHGTSLGDGRFIDQYIYDESLRMVKAYGNHPSFCMLAAGNEPAGRNQAKYLGAFVQYWKARDSRRLYTGASVAMSWPLVPENEYMVKSGARGLPRNNTAPETNSDYSTAVDDFAVPYVSHEMGQWCVFPDFNEIPLYSGAYKARNFELFRQDLADHDMAGMAGKFLMASGKLQTICYKNEIEKALRTTGLAGFQLLGLQDFPGQGTAIVGTLNAFWKEKGYTAPEAFRQFCNATVPLIRTAKFVYTSNEAISAEVEVFHYGASPIEGAVVKWELFTAAGELLQSGRLPPKTIQVGAGKINSAGNLQIGLSEMSRATKLRLQVSLENTAYSNSWEFWVYPASLPPLIDSGIYYCDSLDAKARSVLKKGGKVFLQAAGRIRKGAEVANYFTPVFWNTSWFKMRPPHTLGFVCDSAHPAFAFFPTESHSNLQWWEIVNRAQVMNLEEFPKGFAPMLQPIDTWFMNRKLAIILEAKVGRGRLLICSADLRSHPESRPAAKQLLYSLGKYMRSDKFRPAFEVPMETIAQLFTEPSRETWYGYTKDGPDELKPKPPVK